MSASQAIYIYGLKLSWWVIQWNLPGQSAVSICSWCHSLMSEMTVSKALSYVHIVMTHHQKKLNCRPQSMYHNTVSCILFSKYTCVIFHPRHETPIFSCIQGAKSKFRSNTTVFRHIWETRNIYNILRIHTALCIRFVRVHESATLSIGTLSKIRWRVNTPSA